MREKVYLLKITNNSYKFESTVTALKNGRIVNKPKGYRFQIGDYLMYNKEKDFYFTLLCTNKKICIGIVNWLLDMLLIIIRIIMVNKD